MGRAWALWAATLAGIAALAAPARSEEVDRAPSLIDGVAFVDFSGLPNFKVGDWVRYHTRGSSVRGYQDDYKVTILIAGEEVWWGEPSFWVETTTERDGGTHTTASLVSYSAFGDTMSQKRILWFMRKTINGIRPDGQPDVVLYTREPAEFGYRKINWDQDQENRFRTDTLGTSEVTVAAGKFRTLELLRFRGHSETAERGDSTVFYRRAHRQHFHMNREIPITSLAQVTTDDLQEGRTWMVGQSGDHNQLNVLEHSTGSTDLVESGHGGLTPLMTPVASRRPIPDRRLVREFLSLPQEAPTGGR